MFSSALHCESVNVSVEKSPITVCYLCPRVGSTKSLFGGLYTECMTKTDITKQRFHICRGVVLFFQKSRLALFFNDRYMIVYVVGISSSSRQ